MKVGNRLWGRTAGRPAFMEGNLGNVWMLTQANRACHTSGWFELMALCSQINACQWSESQAHECVFCVAWEERQFHAVHQQTLHYCHHILTEAHTTLQHKYTLSTLCFKKTDTKTDSHNFVNVCPLRMIFLQNALTFNCGLIAFEKPDTGWVPTAWFPRQQPQHATRLNWSSDCLRSRLISNWRQTIVVRAIDQWIKWLQACVNAKGQHFKQLL